MDLNCFLMDSMNILKCIPNVLGPPFNENFACQRAGCPNSVLVLHKVSVKLVANVYVLVI